MKRNLLSRLQRSGWYYLSAALLLLVGVPFYQLLVLNPLNYNAVLNTQGSNHLALYLAWISHYSLPYTFYRLLLVATFALLFTLPFNLFRIIVAQEIVDQQERAEEEQKAHIAEEDEKDGEDEAVAEDGMLPYAWRGKGFAIIAAWSGLGGVIAYILGAVIGTIFVLVAARGVTGTTVSGTTMMVYNICSIMSNTIGIGLLAISTLFFGALIARRGNNLWPTIWVLFGYTALAVAALLSGSAVATASSPGEQAVLTTPAFLLFALWVIWYAFMLIRLKPE